MPSWIIFVNHGNLFLSKLLKIRFVVVYARWRFSRAVGALFILFEQQPETWKNSGENGKFLPDEKKIAKPLFCRYSAPAFLSSTISNGQVSEWSNEHAWKVCVPQTGTEGSNPSLSAILFFLKPCNALDFARLFHIVIAQYLSVFAKKYILGRIDFLRP